MIVVYLLLYVVAVVLFALATFDVVVRRVNLLAAGLFFVALAETLRLLQRV